MEIKLPENAQKLIETAKENGAEAFAVGGCVRDSLLKKEPKDWDITINCTPERTKEIFKNFKTFDTGIRYGTVSVVMGDEIFEVTSYRKEEGYADFRHPEKVVFTKDIENDLLRRDFTINAMAYNKDYGLVDFFGGKEDLINKKIRCVGSPKERFTEDPLRILRGLRFSAVLDFEIEDETEKALFELTHLLRNISAERIKAEFDKLFLSQTRVKETLNKYKEIVFECIPLLKECENYLILTQALEKAETPETKWAILLSGTKDVSLACNNLKFSRKLREICVILNKYGKKELNGDLKEVRYLIKANGIEKAKRIIEFKKAMGENASVAEESLKKIKEKGLCCTLKELKLTGKDLNETGMVPKESYGKILDLLLNSVIEENCENNKENLINKAKELSRFL